MFSLVAVLFSMRDSCLGFPLLIGRPLEGFIFISPHLASRPKPLPSITVLFLEQYNAVLLGVAVEGSTTPFLVSSFRLGSFYSSGILVRKVSREYFNILASGQYSPIIISTVPSLDYIILVSIWSGGLHHHLGGKDLKG